MSGLMEQARSRLPRIAEQAIERARLTVVPRARPAAPKAPFVAVVATVLLLGVVGLLMFNTSMQQASFAAAELEGKHAALRAEEQRLQMEIDRLRDPQRVTQEAQQLGMVPMLTPVFLDLSDGTVVGEPAPASALDRMRLRPRPPQVPAEHRLEPRVVVVPVEAGQGQVTMEGGAPALVGQPEQGSSVEDGDAAGAAQAPGRQAARQQDR
jgi:cell division protein FtsL